MWSLCEHAEEVILLFSHHAKEKTSAAHQGPPVRAQCLLVSPAVLVSCWKVTSHVPSVGPEPAQGREKASSNLGLPGAVLHLPLAAGRVGLGEKSWLFYPCFRGAQGLQCFGT